jgi:hypothetical protein
MKKIQKGEHMMYYIKKILLLSFLLMIFIPTCSANASDEMQKLELNMNKIQDLGYFTDFHIDLQVYIEEEQYIVLLRENSSSITEGATENPNYIIQTNENDIKTLNNLIDSFCDNGKLGILDKIKLLMLYTKYNFNDNITTLIESELSNAVKGSMSAWWM